MRSSSRAVLVGIITFGAVLASGTPAAMAQGGGLGGYGAMADGSATYGGGGASSGMGAVAPFGGRFGAAMPSSSMGGGGGLSFRPRSSATMSGTRTAFTIGPMDGGMGQGSGRRPFILQDYGSAGRSSLGAGMRQRMPATSGMGVMPPSIGYPFRQPTSPSSGVAGTSM
jgi:hypothetical protein